MMKKIRALCSAKRLRVARILAPKSSDHARDRGTHTRRNPAGTRAADGTLQLVGNPPPLESTRAHPRAAAFMAMLGLAASIAVPTPAQAFYTFRDHNRVQHWEEDFALGLVSGWAQQAHVPATSQPFNMHSHFEGYRLEAVRFGIDFTDNLPGNDIAVGICDDDNGLPGRSVAELMLVGRPKDGTVEFRPRQLMGQDPILLPGETYHILFTRGIDSKGNRIGAGYRLGLATQLSHRDYTLGSHSLGFIMRSLFNKSLSLGPGEGGEYGDPQPIPIVRTLV